MKFKIVFLFFLVFSFFLLSEEKNQKKEGRIVAFYFHTTYRCATCLKIENLSRQTIENYFSKEMKDGKIVFMPVNIEEKENRHYVDDYQLYTKSLIFSIFKDGKEVKWKNLDKVWLKVRNEEDFQKYLKEEMESFLKEIK